MQRSLVLFLSAALGVSVFAAGCGTEAGSDFPDGDGTSPGASGASGTSGASGGVIGSSSGGGTSSSGGGASSGGGPTCATASATTTRQPVYLDIILDGSGSMDGYATVAANNHAACVPGTIGGTLCKYKAAVETDPLDPTRKTGKKWLAARGALKAYFDAKGALASNQLGVGMLFFYSASGSAEPSFAEVPIALLDGAQAGALWTPLAPPRFPLGGTPILESVERSANRLVAFVPSGTLATGGRRATLLITDGVPTPGTGSKAEVEAKVVESLAGSPSVATAVIGVGDPTATLDVFDPTFLSGLAQKGGVSAPGCDPAWAAGSAPGTSCHLQVTPGEKTADVLQAEIAAAIDAIAGSLASCELTLDKSSPIDPAKVNVRYVDGSGTSSQVAQDPENGWSYDNPTDPTKVILHGASCDALKADPNGKIDIIIGCPTGTTVVN